MATRATPRRTYQGRGRRGERVPPSPAGSVVAAGLGAGLRGETTLRCAGGVTAFGSRSEPGRSIFSYFWWETITSNEKNEHSFLRGRKRPLFQESRFIWLQRGPVMAPRGSRDPMSGRLSQLARWWRVTLSLGGGSPMCNAALPLALRQALVGRLPCSREHPLGGGGEYPAVAPKNFGPKAPYETGADAVVRSGA